MSSISRLSGVTQEISSTNSYLIYAPFCAKDANSYNSNFIDCYDPSNKSWHRATVIPSIPELGENLVLKDFSMVSIGHHIYIIGGRLCRKLVARETKDIQEIELMILPCVRKYDTKRDSWQICAPMNSPRFDFACTVYNDKIYVAGGRSALGEAKGISSTEIYNPELDEWRFLANMSTMRYKCVATTWQGKIYVLGGFAERGDGANNQGPYVMTRSSAEVYDVQHDKWDFIARMWELDVPPYQIVAVNNKLFSSGDCLKPWKGHIETYDEKENIWNVVHGSHFDKLSPTSMRRLYLTMAPIGNQLYFLTGYKVKGMDNESKLRSEVHVFDVTANGDGWRSLEPIIEEGEKELCGHCCVLKYPS